MENLEVIKNLVEKAISKLEKKYIKRLEKANVDMWNLAIYESNYTNWKIEIILDETRITKEQLKTLVWGNYDFEIFIDKNGRIGLRIWE